MRILLWNKVCGEIIDGCRRIRTGVEELGNCTER
jgi:hypothetical protein